MPTQITKRQHFVPQFYLKKFSSTSKQIYTYDTATQTDSFPLIKDVAQEHYFYDFSPESLPVEHQNTESIQSVETAFSRMENHFSQVLTDILALSATDTLTTEQRERMALFLSFQFVRTRDFRNYVRETQTKLYQLAAKHIVKTKFGDEDLAPIAQVSEKAVALEQNRYIFNLDKAKERATHFLKHIWLVGISPVATNNYTSDSPIVIRNAEGSFGLADGFARKGAEVIFPLSSDRTLILREKTHFQADVNLDGKSIPLTPKEVEEYNSLQVRCCDRHIFSGNNDFSLITNMLTEDPALFSTARERVVIDPTAAPVKMLKKVIEQKTETME